MNETLWYEAVKHAKKIFQMVGFQTRKDAYLQGYYAGALRERQGKHPPEK